jgi:hypothetical protein
MKLHSAFAVLGAFALCMAGVSVGEESKHSSHAPGLADIPPREIETALPCSLQ